MTLATTMTALQTTIETISGYDSTNVQINNARVLSGVTSKSKAIVIYHKPPSPRETLTLGNPVTIRNRWQLRADIYVLTSGDPQAAVSTIEVEVNAVLDAVNGYPNLHAGAGIIYAIADCPEEAKLIEGSNWLMQSIHVEAWEMESITRLESLGV